MGKRLKNKWVKQMRGILINPHDQSISNVETDGSFADIRRLLGIECFTTIQWGNRNHLILDDEGLLREAPGPFFQIAGYDQPLAGKGLILGLDRKGDHVDTTLKLFYMLDKVTFPNVRFVGFEDTSGPQIHPIFGEINVFSRKAIFKEIK